MVQSQPRKLALDRSDHPALTQQHDLYVDQADHMRRGICLSSKAQIKKRGLMCPTCEFFLLEKRGCSELTEA